MKSSRGNRRLPHGLGARLFVSHFLVALVAALTMLTAVLVVAPFVLGGVAGGGTTDLLARTLGETLFLSLLVAGLAAAATAAVVSRDRLLEKVWGGDYFGSDHVIDVHVANLRKKIETDPSDPRYVQTVRGVGYRFRPS